MYQNSNEWITAMKEHSCDNKELIPCDDPSNDICDAKEEGREPTKYPTMGYVCQGCEKVFEISLYKANMDVLPEEQKEIISPMLQSSYGRKKLGEFFSKRKV